MRTPAEIFLNVVSAGGWLRMLDGQLRMALPADCSPELKDAIRQHKPALVNLMRLSFLIVWSKVLDSIIFFVPDDATKESLVSAGASTGTIYTRPELAVLVRQRLTAEELSLIHAAKRRFNGKVTNP
jgi:hypothetical protein